MADEIKKVVSSVNGSGEQSHGIKRSADSPIGADSSSGADGRDNQPTQKKQKGKGKKEQVMCVLQFGNIQKSVVIFKMGEGKVIICLTTWVFCGYSCFLPN